MRSLLCASCSSSIGSRWAAGVPANPEQGGKEAPLEKALLTIGAAGVAGAATGHVIEAVVNNWQSQQQGQHKNFSPVRQGNREKLLTVCTINLESFQKKGALPFVIGSAMLGNDVDVLCVQEAGNAPEIHGYTLQAVSGKGGGECVAVYVASNQKEWGITNVWGNQESPIAFMDLGGAKKRYWVVLSLTHKLSGKKITITNVHLPGGRFDERRIFVLKAVLAVREKLKPLTEMKQLVSPVQVDIVCGDMNSEIEQFRGIVNQPSINSKTDVVNKNHFNFAVKNVADNIIGVAEPRLIQDSIKEVYIAWNRSPYEWLTDNEYNLRFSSSGPTSVYNVNVDVIADHKKAALQVMQVRKLPMFDNLGNHAVTDHHALLVAYTW
eukprot:3188004-Rhodomonas_salina.3